MVYNLSYVYAALILLVVITISYKLKFSEFTMKTQGKFFLGMCITHFLSSIFDVVTVHPGLHGLPCSKWIVTLGSVFYFLSRNALPYLYFVYIISLTKGVNGRVRHIKYILPLCFSYKTILLSIFYPIIFSVDVQGIYNRGKYIVIVYLISVSYLAMGFLYLFKNRALLNRNHRLALQYGFIGITGLVVIMQGIWPEQMVESFGVATCLLMIYLTIESPENSIDRETGTLNKNAFLHDMSLGLKNGQEFDMLSVTLKGQGLLLRTMGLEFMNELRRNIAVEIQEICPQARIYTLSESSYCVIFPSGWTMAAQYAENICGRFDKPFMLNAIDNNIEAAFCLFHCPEDTRDVDNIVAYLSYVENKAADANNKLVYARDIDLNFEERLERIKGAVHRAVRENSFQIYYQPIYSTKDKKFTSAEALLRLEDKELGFISPEEFIPVAEADGSILTIGDFVLEEVCRFMKEAELESLGIRYMEINLSVIQCMNQNLPDKVMGVIGKYGMNPEMINLEITETAAVDSPKMLRLNLEKLVRERVSFSLDDYGTGYSTIDYIIQQPFKLIKLDKSIIWSSFSDAKARIVLESTVSMIRRLNMGIVAEGVETAQQAEALAAMGIEHLQGYYFSRPVPKQEFVEYLSRQSLFQFKP